MGKQHTTQGDSQPGVVFDLARFDAVAEAFRKKYAREPECWVRAPGRVDAMGSHTDYNGGFVLTVPVDRDTWLVAARRDDHQVHLSSLNIEGNGQFDCRDVLAERLSGWQIYVQAVAQLLVEDGYPLTGCDVMVHGTLPIGSGLSSSASLEAAVSVLFSQLGGFQLDPVDMALLCQRAENKIVGVNCGVLDQYSVILGEADSLLLLDCRDLKHSYAALPADILPVICNTCTPRSLSNSAYGERRENCMTGVRQIQAQGRDIGSLRDLTAEDFAEVSAQLDPVAARRCQFVVEENQRVFDLAHAFENDDRVAIGRLCRDSFMGARDLYEITVPNMEAMFAAASESPGIIGVRQAGAGFGGCLVAFVERDKVTAFEQDCARRYQQRSGITPEVYAVAAAPGAGLLVDAQQVAEQTLVTA